MEKSDIAFMILATGMVLLMTPALAFFYGGLVRSKNALNTMMMSFAALGVVGILWAMGGYSLAFCPGGQFIGGIRNVLLNDVDLQPKGAIPHLLFRAVGSKAIRRPDTSCRSSLVPPTARPPLCDSRR